MGSHLDGLISSEDSFFGSLLIGLSLLIGFPLRFSAESTKEPVNSLYSIVAYKLVREFDTA